MYDPRFWWDRERGVIRLSGPWCYDTALFHQVATFLEPLKFFGGHASFGSVAFEMREPEVLQLVESTLADRDEVVESDILHRLKREGAVEADRPVLLDQFIALPPTRERPVPTPLSHINMVPQRLLKRHLLFTPV